jgi:hypothetical protein
MGRAGGATERRRRRRMTEEPLEHPEQSKGSERVTY